MDIDRRRAQNLIQLGRMPGVDGLSVETEGPRQSGVSVSVAKDGFVVVNGNDGALRLRPDVTDEQLEAIFHQTSMAGLFNLSSGLEKQMIARVRHQQVAFQTATTQLGAWLDRTMADLQTRPADAAVTSRPFDGGSGAVIQLKFGTDSRTNLSVSVTKDADGDFVASARMNDGSTYNTVGPRGMISARDNRGEAGLALSEEDFRGLMKAYLRTNGLFSPYATTLLRELGAILPAFRELI